LTENSLHEAALRYLDKQDASVEQVRRILARRVHRYGEPGGKVEVQAEVERVLLRLLSSRLLDDHRYALALAESQRRRGASIPKLRQKLISRGLSQENIEAALESLKGEDELSDAASAATYARKRRLVERHDLNDPRQRQKALAALARQGFSFDVAKAALGL
jgi:regulatory protein